MEPDADRLGGDGGEGGVQELPQVQLVSVRVALRAERAEVGFDPEDLAVVGDADQQCAAFVVKQAADGLDDNVLHLRVGFAGVQVHACGGLEFDRLGFAGGDQVIDRCGRLRRIRGQCHSE